MFENLVLRLRYSRFSEALVAFPEMCAILPLLADELISMHGMTKAPDQLELLSNEAIDSLAQAAVSSTQ